MGKRDKKDLLCKTAKEMHNLKVSTLFEKLNNINDLETACTVLLLLVIHSDILTDKLRNLFSFGIRGLMEYLLKKQKELL